MPREKKNSTAKNTAAKTTRKSADELVKENAAEPETKTVKPTAEKKKATAPRKAAATKSSTKKNSASAVAKVAETKKAAPKTTKKATTNTAKKPAAAKAKTSASSTAKKIAATDSKKHTVRKTAKEKSDEVLLQSSGKDYTLSEITQICKDAYRGGTRKQIKSIKVYVKAEDNQLKAYYVVNDNTSGSVDL